MTKQSYVPLNAATKDIRSKITHTHIPLSHGLNKMTIFCMVSGQAVLLATRLVHHLCNHLILPHGGVHWDDHRDVHSIALRPLDNSPPLPLADSPAIHHALEASPSLEAGSGAPPELHVQSMLGLVELLVEGEADVELVAATKNFLVAFVQGCLVRCSVNNGQEVEILDLYSRGSWCNIDKVHTKYDKLIHSSKFDIFRIFLRVLANSTE